MSDGRRMRLAFGVPLDQFPSGPLSRTARVGLGAGLFVLGFAFYFVQGGLLNNDQFDRISRARQIARYGEFPFRDFFDPGYFMALFSSAALQRLLGDNLLGEVLLDSTCMALGGVLIFFLSRRISGSWALAFIVTVVAVLSMPHYYDYDKCLFYPLGVALCWRYVERPTLASLLALALGTVASGLFRYDSGVYIACAAAVAIAAADTGGVAPRLRQVGTFVLAVTVLALPFLLFVQLTAGISESFRQVAVYAKGEGGPYALEAPPFSFPGSAAFEPPRAPLIRWAPGVNQVTRGELEMRYGLLDGLRDGGRTWTYRMEDPLPATIRALVGDPSVEDTHFIDRQRFVLNPPAEPIRERLGRSALVRWWTVDNADTLFYFLVVALHVWSAFVLVLSYANGRPGDRNQRARLSSLVVMCLVVDVFLFRGYYQVRFGAFGPTAVLAAWALRASGPFPARSPGSADSATRRELTGGRVVGLVSLGVVIVLAVLSLSTVSNWGRSLDVISTTRTTDFATRFAELATPRDDLNGLFSYARDCTQPSDRILATWFVPELYFFSERAFAGGMVVFFGGHWSDLPDQRRIRERLMMQSVPITIIRTGSYDDFQRDYPLVDEYLRLNYRLAGETSFGNPDVRQDAYRVLVHKDRVPTRIDPRWSMPCF